MLSDSRPESLAIRNIPNARLEEDAAAMAWLQEAAPDETVDRLREYVSAQPRRGVEPAHIVALGESLEHAYRVELSWLGSNAQGAFDAVFIRADRESAPVSFPGQAFPGQAGASAAPGVRAWREFANHLGEHLRRQALAAVA